jgi:hypothetical protein
VRGDLLFEGDETFSVVLRPNHTTNDPQFGNTRATVTIVNDDAPASTEAIPAVQTRTLLLMVALLAIVAVRMLR